MAARQMAAQLEQLLGARQGRELAQSQEGRAQSQESRAAAEETRRAELFPQQKQAQELGIQSAQLGLKTEQEKLTGLELQNKRLKGLVEQFSNPKALDDLRKSIEGIDLTQEEKAGFDVALEESKQSFDLTPARTYIKDIILERGRNRRSKEQQDAIEKRLDASIAAADRRFFAGLDLRQKQQEAREGTEDDAQRAADRIASGEVKINDFSVASRNKILRKLEGYRIVPQKTRDELKKLGKGEEVVSLFEKTLDDFADNPTAANAFRLSTQRVALARPIGKGIFGEVGVFTDQDKEDFANILSPGGVAIAFLAKKPQDWNQEDISLAYQAVADIKGLISRIRERELSGSFSQIRRDGKTEDKPSAAKPKSAFDRLP